MSAVSPAIAPDEQDYLDVDRRILCSCGNRTRYVVLVMGSLCLSIIMSSSTAFNFGIICMTDLSTSPVYNGSFANVSIKYDDGDLLLKDRRFIYTTFQRSLLFAGVFAGALLGLFPFYYMITKFGAHRVMTVLGLSAAIFTVLIPFSAVVGFPLFLFLRVTQGLAMSTLFPVVGIIISHWSALKESGLFVSLLTGHVQISSMFTLPVSGVLCSSAGGWPMVYYVHAGLCFVLFVLWGAFFRNHPQKHPFVSSREFRKISIGKSSVTIIAEKPKTPWRAILTTIPLWVTWLANVSNFFVAQFSYTFSPVFYNRVLDFSITESGLMAVIPLTAQLILKFLTGTISDRVTCVSEQTKIRVFNSLAQYGPAVFFVAAAFVPPANRLALTVLVTIASSAIGFNAGGFNKSAVMIARQFSSQVMIVVQIVICLTLFTGSFIVTGLTPENTFEQWRVVFFFYALCLVVCNTIFLIFCSTEPADFTKCPEELVAPSGFMRTVSTMTIGLTKPK